MSSCLGPVLPYDSSLEGQKIELEGTYVGVGLGRLVLNSDDDS
jgi:hypothetical protein